MDELLIRDAQYLYSVTYTDFISTLLVIIKMEPPKGGKFKSNFDKAAKRDPRRAVSGRVITSRNGEMIALYMEKIGININNQAGMRDLIAELNFS